MVVEKDKKIKTEIRAILQSPLPNGVVDSLNYFTDLLYSYFERNREEK